MFDDLSGMDWLVILTALALGFGIVRFLIASVEDRSTGLPAQGGSSPLHEPAQPPASPTDSVTPPPHDR